MASLSNMSKSRHFLGTSTQLCLRSKCNFSTVIRPIAVTKAFRTRSGENTSAGNALPFYNQKRLSSSEWNSYRPTEIQKLSPIDREKELFKVKRRMGAAYSKGLYEVALDTAIELQDKVEQVMGKDNAIYASCLNNIALMNKMLGRKEEALSNYLMALHTYELGGKNSTSYVSTLANLGVLYRLIAEASTGAERDDNLEKAGEALKDALDLRIEMTGPNSRDSLSSANLLAGLWKVAGKKAQAENLLRETLKACRSAFGDQDVITAMTLNNLGVLLKGEQNLQEAQACYREALETRRTLLGDKHSDTVVTMYNLSELLLLAGTESDIKAASELREEIIRNTGADSVYATQDGSAPAAVSESGEEGGVKTFVTDTPLVTKVKGSAEALPPVSEDPNANTAVDHTTPRKRAETAVLPNSVTYATRPKKKKLTTTAP